MALSETRICNASLAKIGSKRLNNLETDTSVEAIHCRTHYEMTRDSLLRSHYWRFASDRATLSQDTVDPDSEWDNQFILPADFIRFKSLYDESGATSRSRRYAIEGQRFLTNDSAVEIRYIKRVKDVAKFDPLFTEVLVLQLALKLVGPLAGGDPGLQSVLQKELAMLMPKAQAVDSDETDTGGRSDWNMARHGGLGIESQSERFW